MPTYDYVCTSCGHEIEVMHPVHGHGPEGCPVCGAPMKKALYLPAVHFKGSGWARKERGPGKSSRAGSGDGDAPAKSGVGSGSGSGSGSESGSNGTSGGSSGVDGGSSGSTSGTSAGSTPKDSD